LKRQNQLTPTGSQTGNAARKRKFDLGKKKKVEGEKKKKTGCRGRRRKKREVRGGKRKAET